MIEYGIDSYVDFETRLQEAGYTGISKKRISEYCNAKFTPSYEKAKILFNFLEWDMTDEEIIASLQANKEYIKSRQDVYRRAGDKELRISVRLKCSKILPDVSPERTGVILAERIKYLTGKSNDYVDYLQALISKDLNEYLLSAESFESEKKTQKTGKTVSL